MDKVLFDPHISEPIMSIVSPTEPRNRRELFPSRSVLSTGVIAVWIVAVAVSVGCGEPTASPLAECGTPNAPIETCSQDGSTSDETRDTSSRADAGDADTAGEAQDVGSDTLVDVAGIDVADASADMSSASEETEPPSLEILFATYNVRISTLDNSAWGDHHVGWDSNDAARMRRAAEIIDNMGLTVVATQEMHFHERKAVTDHLELISGRSWGHTKKEYSREDSFILFDKTVWKKVRETHFKIRLRDGSKIRWQVGALLEHKATSRKVWFYSVHFSAGSSLSAAQMRKEAARITVESIRNHAVRHDLPFVLGGDFNSVSGGPVGDVFRNTGFMKDSRKVARQRRNNGCRTFNPRAGSAGLQSCPGGWARHIDQVWVRKRGMKVPEYKVFANQRTSRASDHNPVKTVIELL